jgi:hypothetical protein
VCWRSRCTACTSYLRERLGEAGCGGRVGGDGDGAGGLAGKLLRPHGSAPPSPHSTAPYVAASLAPRSGLAH